MSAPPSVNQNAHDTAPRATAWPAGGPLPPPPPRVDMMASREMQEWIARLKGQERRLGTRNRYLAVVLAAAIVLLAGILWGVHHATIGAYAVLDDVQINHDPVNQANVLLSFRVVSAGKVYYRRSSGENSAEVIDHFRAPGQFERSWAWAYEPGKPIDISLSYRGGLMRRTRAARFATSNRADIVFLIDTTGSMGRSIAELKEKCVAFSEALGKQALEHRFALIGFGDTKEREWLDKYDFTTDVGELRTRVEGLKRFEGGDLPESALDALEEALTLPFDSQAMRRFYLVTDAPYHSPTRSGAAPEQVARQLKDARVVLYVFSRGDCRDDYGKLLSGPGRFQDLESFGKVLSEGCILED